MRSRRLPAPFLVAAFALAGSGCQEPPHPSAKPIPKIETTLPSLEPRKPSASDLVKVGANRADVERELKYIIKTASGKTINGLFTGVVNYAGENYQLRVTYSANTVTQVDGAVVSGKR